MSKEDEDRRALIEDARQRDVCPQCGEPLGEGRVGSGRLSDGVFCGLDCLAKFHEDYFEKRRREGGSSPN